MEPLERCNTVLGPEQRPPSHDGPKPRPMCHQLTAREAEDVDPEWLRVGLGAGLGSVQTLQLLQPLFKFRASLTTLFLTSRKIVPKNP